MKKGRSCRPFLHSQGDAGSGQVVRAAGHRRPASTPPAAGAFGALRLALPGLAAVTTGLPLSSHFDQVGGGRHAALLRVRLDLDDRLVRQAAALIRRMPMKESSITRKRFLAMAGSFSERLRKPRLAGACRGAQLDQMIE
jgi:hypothetical protein